MGDGVGGEGAKAWLADCAAGSGPARGREALRRSRRPSLPGEEHADIVPVCCEYAVDLPALRVIETDVAALRPCVR